MKPAWPMLSRPVKPKWMLRTITAIATAAVVGAIASRSDWLRMLRMVSMSMLLSADSSGAAEEALRSEQQQDDQDPQRHGVLEVAGGAEGACELDHEADDQ